MENNLIKKIIKEIKNLNELNIDLFNLKNNKKINNNINKLEFLNGTFSERDFLSPSFINNSNPKYLEIDNIYYSSLLVINYYREQTELILKSIIDINIDVNIAIFYEKHIKR